MYTVWTLHVYLTALVGGAGVFSSDIYMYIYKTRASLVAQTVKRLPAMRETWV